MQTVGKFCQQYATSKYEEMSNSKELSSHLQYFQGMWKKTVKVDKGNSHIFSAVCEIRKKGKSSCISYHWLLTKSISIVGSFHTMQMKTFQFVPTYGPHLYQEGQP